MTNAPRFTDFLAERIGHRHWYTSKRPSPVRRARLEYIAPKRFQAFKAEYADLFGGLHI